MLQQATIVDLLKPHPSFVSGIPKQKVVLGAAHVVGVVSAIAFVHPKEELSAAIKVRWQTNIPLRHLDA
jgi:hypothetical protein